ERSEGVSNIRRKGKLAFGRRRSRERFGADWPAARLRCAPTVPCAAASAELVMTRLFGRRRKRCGPAGALRPPRGAAATARAGARAAQAQGAGRSGAGARAAQARGREPLRRMARAATAARAADTATAVSGNGLFSGLSGRGLRHVVLNTPLAQRPSVALARMNRYPL